MSGSDNGSYDDASSSKGTDAKPTYEQHESTITDTEIRVASYAANVEETVVTGYEETKGQMHDKALAITEPYLMYIRVWGLSQRLSDDFTRTLRLMC